MIRSHYKKKLVQLTSKESRVDKEKIANPVAIKEPSNSKMNQYRSNLLGSYPNPLTLSLYNAIRPITYKWVVT